jgi:hypothetical protein
VTNEELRQKQLLNEIRIREFVEQIARMTKDREIEGGMSWEDAVDTVDGLIVEARELTGIDPAHLEYCADCGLRLPVEGGSLCEECAKEALRIAVPSPEEVYAYAAERWPNHRLHAAPEAK